MQYKNSQKIIIDKRKLDILIRLGDYDKQILELIKTGEFTKTGDNLVDDTLECLLDVKSFSNWGGKRENAGRPHKNQDENQLDNHLENQDAIQVVDKDKDIYIYNNRPVDNVDNFSEKKVLIEEGKFHIDETMPEYKDLLWERMDRDDISLRVWKWVMSKYEGKEVKISFIRSLIEKFKN